MKPALIFAIAIIAFGFPGCKKAENAQPLQDTIPTEEHWFICGIGPSATFPGGHEAWLAFLKKETNIDMLLNNGAPAGDYTAVIQFKIDTNGHVFDAKPLTNAGYGAKQEAIRVIQKSGRWQPEMFNGEAVVSILKQAITFRLEDEAVPEPR